MNSISPLRSYIRALLIGGPRDGARVDVLPEQEIISTVARLPAPELAAERSFCQAVAVVDERKIERYFRVRYGLSDGMRKGEFALFLHETLDADALDVVQALYMGYREEKTDES